MSVAGTCRCDGHGHTIRDRPGMRNHSGTGSLGAQQRCTVWRQFRGPAPRHRSSRYAGAISAQSQFGEGLGIRSDGSRIPKTSRRGIVKSRGSANRTNHCAVEIPRRIGGTGSQRPRREPIRHNVYCASRHWEPTPYVLPGAHRTKCAYVVSNKGS